MAKLAIVKDIVIGKPICEPWYMFCNEQNEWDDIKDNVLFTEERYLPKLMVESWKSIFLKSSIVLLLASTVFSNCSIFLSLTLLRVLLFVSLVSSIKFFVFSIRL